jgi:hypothetical protein
MDDKALVGELIANEFNLQPTINHCRRLGNAIVNKTQSLLVTLDSLDHVNIVKSNAKQLRRSVNDFVRENIFINADLTKAESTVAYEERCRRRHLRQERSSKQLQTNKTGVLTATTTASSTSSSTVSGSLKSVGANHTVLNVAVPVFQPASSSKKPDSLYSSKQLNQSPFHHSANV